MAPSFLEERRGPRTDAATGEVRPEAEMIRFVGSPEGRVVPDLAARLPGRGLWVGASRDSLAKARKRGAFKRGLKLDAHAELEAEIEALLARRCLEQLGLARKAGALAIGYDQAESALRAGTAFGLVEASDGSGDGRGRLVRLWASCAKKEPALLVGCFTGADLGVALGRLHVVHIVWLHERMARRWAAEISRLAGFRAITPSSWGPVFRASDGAERSEQSPRPDHIAE